MNIDLKECPPYLRGFITYLRAVRGRSERTVEAYYSDLRTYFRFLKWTTQDIPDSKAFNDIEIKDLPFETVKNVTMGGIYEYINFLAEDSGNNERTRCRKLSAMRSFYKALHRDKIEGYHIDKNPMENIDSPSLRKTKPKYLDLESSRRLLENIPNDSSDDYIRDYCIITLFINCGMRLSELVGLNINDISFSDSTMRLLGKGNKERIIHINKACTEVLKEYLEVRPESDIDPNALFISKKKRRISRRRVEQIVENCLRSSSLENRGISTHKLRHTAATLMYQYGNVDTLVLKEILGHASTATTEIYTHLANDNVRKALDSNPLADELPRHTAHGKDRSGKE